MLLVSMVNTGIGKSELFLSNCSGLSQLLTSPAELGLGEGECDGRVSERAGENGLPTVGRCRSGKVE